MNSALSEIVQKAMSAHRSGNIIEAETLYNQILNTNPNHFEALHFLGLLKAQQGQLLEADRLVSRSLEVNSSVAEAFANHARILRELNRPKDALDCCERALAINRQFVDALVHRSNALSDLGRYEEALASIERALQLNASYPVALVARGDLLGKLNRQEEALVCYDRAIGLRPAYPEAHNNRGIILGQLQRFNEALCCYDRAIAAKPNFAEAFNNRGFALHHLKSFSDALAAYDRAISINPRCAEAYNNRGWTLHELKRYDEALSAYDRAIEIKPDYAEALSNRGWTLHEVGRFDEALHFYERALTIKPDYPEALCNRGVTLHEIMRFDEAVESYDRAIALNPSYGLARFNRACTHLLRGDFVQGLRDYEYRLEVNPFSDQRPLRRIPAWMGEPLRDRRILVISEQGRGDLIQGARYLPTLANLAAGVGLIAPRSVFRLLQGMSASVEFMPEYDEAKLFDFHCPLMSLPHRLKVDLKTLSAGVPYLRAENGLVERWRRKIGPHGFKIGICWQGNPNTGADKGRSVPLFYYAALAAIPGVRLVSLQRVNGLDQLKGLPAGMKVETYADLAPADDFVDVAAIMSNVDLIITSDTAIAHLAGALGRPCWVALKHVPDWRWLLDRDDCPWYPAMRLFRQTRRGDWDEVFARIAVEVKMLAGCGLAV